MLRSEKRDALSPIDEDSWFELSSGEGPFSLNEVLRWGGHNYGTTCQHTHERVTLTEYRKVKNVPNCLTAPDTVLLND